MSTRMLIGVAGGLAVGLVAGWLSRGSDASGAEAPAQDVAELRSENARIAGEKDAASAEVKSLQRRIGQLDRELADARAAAAAAAETVAAAEPETAPETETVDAEAADVPSGQAFSFPDFDEELAAVDWAEAGGHVAAMAPLLAEIMTAVANGEQPPPAAIGAVQQHNGPLVTIAMTLHGKLPGETVNGSQRDIAGVLNKAGNVLGMMPHPERAVEDAQGNTDGRALFESIFSSLAVA